MLPVKHVSRRQTLGLLGGLAVATTAGAETPQKLRIRLDWTPWGNQAGIHLANVKGWYRDAGLDVTIDDGNGSTGTVQIVGTGDDYDVGFAALSSMMVARSKGLKLRAIACYARNSDIGLMVPDDSGISKVSDLKGKKLAYTASSLETPFLATFLKAGGLTRSDCELINMNGSAKLAAYLDKRVDGAFSSIPFFVPAVSQTRPSHGIRFSDAGLYIPSYGLFARQSVIDKRADPLTRFVSATNGAWAYIVAGHQAAGVAAIRTDRPEAKLSTKVMAGQVASFITFFPTEATKGKPVGTMAEADWARATEAMKSVDLISADLKPADFYTNALFDPALYRRIAGV
ncbi:MAG: ABC transporter substrate-binding protein [Acetobacteraceae bacterium]